MKLFTVITMGLIKFIVSVEFFVKLYKQLLILNNILFSVIFHFYSLYRLPIRSLGEHSDNDFCEPYSMQNVLTTVLDFSFGFMN